jgi:Domain of Unknown Function (DUF1080)
MKIPAKIALLCVALFCFASAWAGCRTAPGQKPEGIDLFNGKDFSGWTFFMRSNSPPAKTWGITNGIIHCTGAPNGFMRTEKSFHDYKLTVEWRFLRVAPYKDNTGVLAHMQLPDKVWPKCFECQGLHNHQGDFWLWGGADCAEPKNMKKNGVAMLQPSNENPVGEWNAFQIICSGDTIEIIVNGKSMNKITGTNVSSGFIGIQCEGADMEVRKIFLEPLK